jgi:hypothetical protein
MTYIPDSIQVNAARELLRAEAEFLRAEVHRARTQFRFDRNKETRAALLEAQRLSTDTQRVLTEARTTLYLQCGYQPEQVNAALAAALVPGTQEVLEGRTR